MTNFIGQPLNEAVEKIKNKGQDYRILKEGAPNLITADYKPERYNIWVDDTDTIVRVDMG